MMRLAVFIAPLVVGCSGYPRATLASFVPTVELAARVRRDGGRSVDHERSHDRWDASISAWLRWRPRIAASEVPLRFELGPESALLPCELDDDVCIREAAEVERELAHVLGELP